MKNGWKIILILWLALNFQASAFSFPGFRVISHSTYQQKIYFHRTMSSEKCDFNEFEDHELFPSADIHDQRAMQSFSNPQSESESNDDPVDYFTRCCAEFDHNLLGVLEAQLQFRPCNVVKIGASISIIDPSTNESIEYPQVAILYPLNVNNLNGRYSKKRGLQPFPTTVWMTCPHLQRRISLLEGKGYISVFQTRLEDNGTPENTENRRKMLAAHRQYAEYRWNLLSEEDKQLVEQNGW